MQHAILFRSRLFYEYIDLENVCVPVEYRVNQAEYAVRILVAASQEYVNTYSTRRPVSLHSRSPTIVPHSCRPLQKTLLARLAGEDPASLNSRSGNRRAAAKAAPRGRMHSDAAWGGLGDESNTYGGGTDTAGEGPGYDTYGGGQAGVTYGEGNDHASGGWYNTYGEGQAGDTSGEGNAHASGRWYDDGWGEGGGAGGNHTGGKEGHNTGGGGREYPGEGDSLADHGTNAASHTTGRYNGGRQQNGWCVLLFVDMYIHTCVYHWEL